MGHELGETKGAATEPEKPNGAVPGKSTRTGNLPTHHEMTGIDAIDLADSLAAQDERDGFSPSQRAAAMMLVGNACSAMFGATRDGIQNALIQEHIKKVWTVIEWNALMEMLWAFGTGPLEPLLSRAIAHAANGFAVPAAELGLTRAAWTLAGDAKQMSDVSRTWLKSMRTHVAHPHAPQNQADLIAFVHAIQSAQGPAQNDFIAAALTLSTKNLLGLYAALSDRDVYNVEIVASRVERLIKMFDDNRIASMGDVLPVYGGLDAATVRRVRVRGREFVVLLASRGHDHPSQGGGKPTDLEFVRFVEKEMHQLAISQLKSKQGPHALEGRSVADMFMGAEHDEVTDLDHERSAPWAAGAIAEYKKHRVRGTLDAIAASGDDPYAVHLVAAGDADAP